MVNIYIKSFRRFLTLLENHYNSNYIFRGENSTEYKLIPKIGREPYTEKLSKDKFADNLQSLEENTMRDFVRMSIPYLYLRNISHLEQWTIAQHHGLPTRFLDWTENPLIAAYFATENSGERDVVIYAMDKTQFNVIFEQEDTDIFSLPEEDKVVFYTPSYFHPRIIAQKGVFTIHASPTTPLDKTRINNHNCKIERIIIKNNIVPEFIHNLDWFGINRSFIYPGLDGLAYHLDSKAKGER